MLCSYPRTVWFGIYCIWNDFSITERDRNFISCWFLSLKVEFSIWYFLCLSKAWYYLKMKEMLSVFFGQNSALLEDVFGGCWANREGTIYSDCERSQMDSNVNRMVKKTHKNTGKNVMFFNLVSRNCDCWDLAGYKGLLRMIFVPGSFLSK